VSATVETVYLYEARCAECFDFSPVSASENEAEQWAATHDAENHAEDDREDEKYERFREARYDD
jgi:hypothetical protein